MKVTFPEGPKKELEEVLRQEKDVRVFKRSQDILRVVQGSTLKEASQMFCLTYQHFERGFTVIWTKG